MTGVHFILEIYLDARIKHWQTIAHSNSLAYPHFDALEVSVEAEGVCRVLVASGVPDAIVAVCELFPQELARAGSQATVFVGIVTSLVSHQLQVLGFHGGKVDGCGGRVPNAESGGTMDLDAMLALTKETDARRCGGLVLTNPVHLRC